MEFYTEPNDTHPKVARLMRENLWRMGAKGRAKAAARLTARNWAGMKRAFERVHPDWSEQQLSREWVRIQYGEELARNYCGRWMKGSPMSPEVEAFIPVVEVIESLGVDYCVVGSVAAYAHGHARSTGDVDVLVLGMEPEHATALAQSLGDSYHTDDLAIADAVREQGIFNLLNRHINFKVDFFVRTSSRYEQVVMARRERSALFEDEEPQFWVESVEDVVLSKLRWFRMGGEVSMRQWMDVQKILEFKMQFLDSNYLDHWGRELGISDLLQTALEQARLERDKQDKA